MGILEGRGEYIRGEGGGAGVSEGVITEKVGWCGYVSTPLQTWDLGYPSTHPILTPSAGHHNTCSWQAGGMHPTGILSFSVPF